MRGLGFLRAARQAVPASLGQTARPARSQPTALAGPSSAASRKYSEALTDEQEDACISAGAKRRSRPRLAQSGPLTGQQWWVHSQCAGEAEGATRNAQTAAKPLQTQGISLPTWEPHRGTSVAPPWQHCGNKRRASPRCRKSEIRRPNHPPLRQASNPPPRSRVRISAFGLLSNFGLRPSDFSHARSVVLARSTPGRGAERCNDPPVSGAAC